MRAAIYARISFDRDAEGAGVERQEADCRELCAARGWEIAEVFVDNDISAFNPKAKRPGFEALLACLAEQTVDTVVVWKTDRLARRGRDLQRFLDAAGNATLTSCTEPEFTGATGLLMLRIINGFAEHESGVKSERVARKMKAKAQAGDPPAGGKRCFGYDTTGRHIVEAEAALIRSAVARLLVGEPANAILRDWLDRGVQTVSGGLWRVSNWNRLMLTPRIAGLRTNAGEIVAEGNWPAIITPEQHHRLVAMYDKRRRQGIEPAGRKYLLTGILKCGRCGALLQAGATGRLNTPTYRCPPRTQAGCGGISIAVDRVEEYVVPLVLAAVEGPWCSLSPDESTDEVLDALAAAEASLSQVAKDHYVEKLISRPAFLAASSALEQEVRRLRTRLERTSAAVSIGEDGVVADWERKGLAWRQQLVRAVLEQVVVNPAPGVRPQVEDRVELIWRA